jgi:hypothetical protein
MAKQTYAEIPKQRRSAEYVEPESTNNETHAQEHHKQVVEETEKVLAHIDEMVVAMSELAIQQAA